MRAENLLTGMQLIRDYNHLRESQNTSLNISSSFFEKKSDTRTFKASSSSDKIQNNNRTRN